MPTTASMSFPPQPSNARTDPSSSSSSAGSRTGDGWSGRWRWRGEVTSGRSAEGAKSEFAAATLRVGAGGGAATVRLGPTGTLLPRLRADEAGYDAARLRIRVLDADGRDLAAEAAALGRRARFRDDDRYVLPILPARFYRVQVDDGKKSLLDEAVRISAGDRTERALR